VIHQALFGYGNGHELLASSVTLTREQRSALAQATDLSGPGPTSGFDGYISGFPLAGGLYVLAKTWYATELPRPGCVWTHALLLQPAEFDSRDIVGLSTLFSRPRINQRKNLERYAAQLEQPSGSVSTDASHFASLPSVLFKLYNEPTTSVTVLTDSAASLEFAFLSIWSQQWDSLRWSFSFTTGMLGSGVRRFDLQGVPHKNRRLFQAASSFSIVDTVDGGDAEWAEWSARAADDASSPSSQDRLRDFLWEFGSDFREGRKAFRPLAETYCALTRTDPHARAKESLHCVAALPGELHETARIKAVLFGGLHTRWSLDEAAALEVLASDPLGTLVEVTEEDMFVRASRLDPYVLETIVGRVASEGRFGRVQAIFDAFTLTCDAASVARAPLELAATAIRRRRDIARDPNAWRRSGGDEIRLVESVISVGEFNGDMAYGLLCLGNMRLLVAARAAPSRAWVEGAHAFTDDLVPNPDVEEFLMGRLWSARHDVRARLHAGKFGRFLKFAAAVLDVTRDEAANLPLGHADTERELPILHDRGAETRAAAFLVIVGLTRNEPSAGYCLSCGFSNVYEAARNDELPWDVWRGLESELPWHLFDWDRCARLVEGAAARFPRNGWPARTFMLTFRTEEEFGRAVGVLEATRDVAFVARLRDEVARSPTAHRSFHRTRLSLPR
jgi:hypothetical protein